jgi:hypothetical protein
MRYQHYTSGGKQFELGTTAKFQFDMGLELLLMDHS